MAQYTVAVAGASGYAGGEILRLLAQHPHFQVRCVTGYHSSGDQLGDYMPHLPLYADLTIQDTTAEILNGHDIIILALPHGASGALSEQLNSEAIVVDLGADHRLEQATAWQDFYGGTFYPAWTYGMPELMVGKNTAGDYLYQRSRLATSKRIAVPGCNVTAVTLALQPAVAEDLIAPEHIVAQLVVGYSGAGKNLNQPHLLAAEAIGTATPYAVAGRHRHIPEILQNFAQAAGLSSDQANKFGLAFTPVLVPMSRGILACVSAAMTPAAQNLTDEQIRDYWLRAYQHEVFMQLLPPGKWPSTHNVIGSNSAHIQVAVDRRAKRILCCCAIDNLTRGTAGQALQSLNIALGVSETTALSTLGVAP
ncbi:N-acetyl-gamma-glutamyl-phosphate reductase [Neisseriaceae bacterium ESL0693]|nr:N-acetyl-gamma-glutamyl-phosphate reductase [Neisseriaceae bacterium ESL0693]